MKSNVLLTLCLAILLVGSATAETTITWWQFWTDPAIKPTIQKIVSEFEQANPDIKVKLTDLTWANGHEKIVIGFASGTGPDIVELGSDWIAQFADNEQLADLSAEMQTDSTDYQGWGMATYKDKVYAYPWILGTRVLFVNRDIVKKGGFEDNWLPFNLAQLEHACKEITSEGRGSGFWAWGSNTAEKHRLYKKFLPFFWSSGARIFSPDNKYCVVSSQMGVDALRLYKRLHDEYAYVDNQRGIEDAFLDGKIGFILSGDWLLKRIELEKRKLNFTTTVFPGQKYPGRSFLGGEFLAVNQASKHKAEAIKFIRFLTSPENQVRFCKANRSANPSSKQAQQDPYFSSNENLQTFIKQIQLAIHPPVDPNWVYIEDELESAVEDALFGEGLPATALLRARQNIEALREK